ncbi:S41 family peptidase [Aurantiacibacter gangjinensis]|uniref:Tail specific protease domain-containing protein n=1 Tax=Aurantiacibacter gangjinensis TaxID=502682 RepID=A0A0G9MLZ0_9SPHN|nr:S41 family peptidase [Aurantiacibacter gangjinensis]KLE31707.1 hypothetical protein AAW01_09340 [Aurantiacibacter gangjinensis]
MTTLLRSFGVAVAALLLAPATASAQATQYDGDIMFLTRVIEREYAGFDTKTEGNRRQEYEAQLSLMNERIAANPEARIHAISALLDWFADGHLAIQSNIVSPDDPYPDAAPERHYRIFDLPFAFTFTRLSDHTVMLRVPHFGMDAADELAALLEQHHDTITSTPNLIIDMRGNSGGSDLTYAPLMAYLYTRPIYSVGAELRVSQRNLDYLRELGGDEDMPQEVRNLVANVLASAEQGADYVPLGEDAVSIETYPQVYDFPRRVGILAEGAGSSGDQFAIDARFSDKVTFFGGPTAGVIDYSNVIEATSPSGDFTLRWPMTRSMRLPEEPFDNVGVPADVPFGDDVADHVEAARLWLESRCDCLDSAVAAH